jgi:hypothetical protein
MIAPFLYIDKKCRGSSVAICLVSGSSKLTYGLARNIFFTKVVLPDCLGPTIAKALNSRAIFEFLLMQFFVSYHKNGKS